MSTSHYELIGVHSMAKNSSPSRAPKTGAQLRDNREEREKCPPLHRRQTTEEARHHCAHWNVYQL